MSFLAATRSTSIWPVPVSTSGGVRICTSMFTSLTSTSLTELLPMSSPRASLLFAMVVQPLLRGTLSPETDAPKKTSKSGPPRSAVEAGEDLAAVLQAEAEREEDPALGLHPAVVARFDAIDG